METTKNRIVINSTCKIFSSAKVSKLAPSDITAEAEIQISGREDGSLNHDEARTVAVEESIDSVMDRIQTITLDQFCEDEGIEKLGFIKCDVEGCEIAVFSGGEELLRFCHPTILL